jgi:hypothetical protein
MAIKRRDQQKTPGTPGADFGQCGFSRQFPQTFEFFTSERYDDGTPRQLPTALLFYANGACRVCVRDRDNNCEAWLTATSLTSLITLLEQQLAGELVDWVTSAGFGKKKR